MRLGSQASGIPAGRDDGLLNEHLCFQPLTYGRLLPQPQDTQAMSISSWGKGAAFSAFPGASHELE